MQKLAKKFVDVMKECGHVAKNGENSFHNYKYATAADVLAMVNDSLTKHGIMTAVETNLLDMREVTTAKGNREILATVETVITFIDSDSGENTKIKGIGSGQDAGDKSIAKAQTQALKYTYLDNFAIATGDDPEADTRTDEVMQPNNFTTPRSALICDDCGKTISQKVADFSHNKFGRPLCMDCQHSQSKVA